MRTYRGTSLIKNTPPVGPYRSPRDPRKEGVSYERGTPVTLNPALTGWWTPDDLRGRLGLVVYQDYG